MKRFIIGLAVALSLTQFGAALNAAEDGLPSGIAFYGVLQDGLKQAKETNRPIFLLSAAPQCAGVPGMW